MERLKSFIEKNRLIAEGNRVGAAVSGGPDSVFMLRALVDLAPFLDFSVVVLHFNHKLREESDDEEAFVAELCRRLSVEFYSDSCDVALLAQRERICIEDAARRARYDFFSRSKQKLSLDSVALAHTKNDVAETLLMNLLRGSSLKGLVSMRPRREFYIRPVLPLRKEEIELFLKERGERFVVDSSNENTDFLRNRIRKKLIPYLEEFNPSIIETLFRTSETLRADEEMLEFISEKEIARRVAFSGKRAYVEMDNLQIGIKRRLISHVCRRLLNTPYSLSFNNIERIVHLKPHSRVVLRGILKAHRDALGRVVIERL